MTTRSMAMQKAIDATRSSDALAKVVAPKIPKVKIKRAPKQTARKSVGGMPVMRKFRPGQQTARKSTGSKQTPRHQLTA